ncbi:hypothetical protein [Actinomadura monticuli]|uniref:Uncharacterized protein n=1 Tax=Actinomadura monticuli TaxID=3097367 RepID=A0ABV4Q981_9ACTN
MSVKDALAIALGLVLSLPFPSVLFIRVNARRLERRRRAARAAAHDALANALTHYRRAELHYIRRRLGSPGTSAARDAHAASFRERSAVQHALFLLRTASTDPRIVALAERAFELTGLIHDASTLEEATRDAARADQAVRDFVTATGATVHPTTARTELRDP